MKNETAVLSDALARRRGGGGIDCLKMHVKVMQNTFHVE